MTLSQTLPRRTLPIGDQAQALRGLMQQFQSNRREPMPNSERSRAAAIAVTSGKGGVGKTNIALNLAIALARRGAAAAVIDASLGLGNIDLLCGLNGYWNLSHVMTGARTIRDVVLSGPEGIHVLPGAADLADLANCPAAAQADVLRQLCEFETSHDFLIVDAAPGLHPSARTFLDACDLALVVTTPEPTSVADAYSTIKALSAGAIPHIEVLVNQYDFERQARMVAERIQETARLFLRRAVESTENIPRDRQVYEAVSRRRPFLITSPESPASSAIIQLAARISRLFEAQPHRGSFFSRLQTGGQRARAAA